MLAAARPCSAAVTTGPQPVEVDKLRGKPEKFSDHYTQATLFWNSRADWEKGACRRRIPHRAFEGDRAGDSRANGCVARERGARVGGVAKGLGIKVPAAMPRALARPRKPEVSVSSALSLTALPGDGGIRTRRIAMLDNCISRGADARPSR